MIHFTTGNLLNSSAEYLVNAVNCEGIMGKGLAYQFKLKFPKMYENYRKACKNGTLTIGKLHCYKENNKTIINFPTKDKWTQKSDIKYIITGLNKLVELTKILNIKNIAIPALGCGNGGLNWKIIKLVIINKLTPLKNHIDIFVYEPFC